MCGSGRLAVVVHPRNMAAQQTTGGPPLLPVPRRIGAGIIGHNGPIILAIRTSMKLRRCRILFVDRRAVGEFVLEDLLSGGTGIGQRDCWIAMAPHVGAEVELLPADLAILEAVGCDVPVEREALERRFDPVRVASLVDAGLLLGDHAAHKAWTVRDAGLSVPWNDLLIATLAWLAGPAGRRPGLGHGVFCDPAPRGQRFRRSAAAGRPSAC